MTKEYDMQDRMVMSFSEKEIYNKKKMDNLTTNWMILIRRKV